MREEYVRKSINEICDKASSNIAQKKIVDMDGNYPVYGASGYVQNIDFYHRDTDYIGIVKDGSGVGRVNIYPAYSSLLGTMQYIIPKEGYHIGYVAYALKGLNLSSFATGAAIPHIYFKDYGKCKIDVPPLAEQERIVAELDLLSSIIEKKKAQLKELDQLAQSIFYNMFGDPITNEKGWKVQALSTVCDVRDGTHDSPKYVDNGYPLITSKNVVNGTISFDNVNLISERDLIAINARSKVDDGDIIMPMIGTIGKPTIVIKTREFAIKNVALIKFSEAKRVLNIYIQKLLDSESYSRFIKEQNRGGTQKFISLGMIRKLPTPLPPLPLQQEFADKVEAIERQKSLIQQSIDEVQTLFDSRMDYWFG